MTDQTTPDVTDDDRRLARKWAESIESATNSVESTTNPWSDRARAAARVILRDVPAPSRPTLADMTDEERYDCQRMQADVKGAVVRAVILNPDWEGGRARVMWEGGLFEWIDWSDVTPRPDLPRLEWPGDKKPAPVLPGDWRLAAHRERGRVIVTNPTPNRNGHVTYVLPATDPLGYDWFFCRPDDLTYIDQEADTPDAVPPNTLAVGSEWGDIDALTLACETSGRNQIVVADCDGDVFVWGADAEWWETGTPSDGYDPYTIIHAGKGGDQ